MTDQEMQEAVESRLKRIFITDGFDDQVKRRIYLGDMPEMDKYLRARDQISIERSAGNFPTCLLPCFKEPILSKVQEFHQARKYNLLKHIAKERLEDGQLRYAYCLIQRAIEVGNQIAEANFRLAASVIRKKVGLKEEENLSDAYLDVMKAVDYFNYTIGNKFSTYTTFIIHRTLIRSWQIRQRESDRGFFFVNNDLMAETYESSDCGYEEENQHEINKQTVSNLLNHCGSCNASQADLDRRKFILTHRFGLGSAQEMTLEELGKELGISKERVRQLEKNSLENIIAYLKESRDIRKKVA